MASGKPLRNGPLPTRLLVLALVIAGCAAASAVSSADVARVRDWAARQSVPLGEVRSAKLPPGTITFAAKRDVPIVHLKDGRTCFLLVTKVGYKQNFEGVASCTQPLLPHERIPAHDPYGASISLTDCVRTCDVFEELYVRQARDDRTFDVYYDLN